MTSTQTESWTRLVAAVRSHRLGHTLSAVYASRAVQMTLCALIGAAIVGLLLVGLFAAPLLAWAVFS